MPSSAAAGSFEFRIFETDEFEKAFKKIGSPAALRKKLASFVYPQLRKGPFFGPNIRKLKGYNPETWRYRIGDYRVFYSVDDAERIVFVLSVDNRKDAYK